MYFYISIILSNSSPSFHTTSNLKFSMFKKICISRKKKLHLYKIYRANVSFLSFTWTNSTCGIPHVHFRAFQVGERKSPSGQVQRSLFTRCIPLNNGHSARNGHSTILFDKGQHGYRYRQQIRLYTVGSYAATEATAIFNVTTSGTAIYERANNTRTTGGGSGSRFDTRAELLQANLLLWFFHTIWRSIRSCDFEQLLLSYHVRGFL